VKSNPDVKVPMYWSDIIGPAEADDYGKVGCTDGLQMEEVCLCWDTGLLRSGWAILLKTSSKRGTLPNQEQSAPKSCRPDSRIPQTCLRCRVGAQSRTCE
jgi:hypothetical protein